MPLTLQQLLELKFTTAHFSLQEDAKQPVSMTPVMQIYSDQLQDIGFSFSHELLVEHCIGKPFHQPARMLVYLNASQSAYAILTDLYHVKSWVYFTNYFAGERRAITTCQPGALKPGSARNISTSAAGFELQETSATKLKSQWHKHQNFISSKFATEKALQMDPHQHLEAEREAYRKYTEFLLDCVVLRQSDTQLVGFTHTGASGYLDAITSKSAKRPNPKIDRLVSGTGTSTVRRLLNFQMAALAASAALLVFLVYQFATLNLNPTADTLTASIPAATETPVNQPASIAVAPADDPDRQPVSKATAGINTENQVKDALDDVLAINSAPGDAALPERYVIASEEDEMWRIAVENAEFYLMSNDGDPAPWIRTARKMAAGFIADDPRLARTHFLAAMLERDPQIAEQQYNRALSIQTKTLGLYHTETAQTLEALAWVAEGARDDLEEAITHQKLALNVYRSIFGEEAEDTRAARWKLQYFEDRLEGRRPKSEDNRRLLPALARFSR